MEDPRIIRKESFNIIGYALSTTVMDGRNFREIPAFWDRLQAEGKLDHFPGRLDPDSMLGICMDFNEEEGSFTYIVGVEVAGDDTLPDDMVMKRIPAATYAVFQCRGKLPEAIHDAVGYIYENWLPASEYKRAAAADFERYRGGDPDGGEMTVDIHIPIEPR